MQPLPALPLPCRCPSSCPAFRLDLVGLPCDSRAYVFDGDFVDRGAWGLEVVLLLAAWKVAAPRRVWLVRGNHESTYCSWVYGFRKEVLAKYSSAKDGEVGAVALSHYIAAFVCRSAKFAGWGCCLADGSNGSSLQLEA